MGHVGVALHRIISQAVEHLGAAIKRLINHGWLFVARLSGKLLNPPGFGHFGRYLRIADRLIVMIDVWQCAHVAGTLYVVLSAQRV